jgi:Ca2+-binding EF-hand superfamily protein
MLYLHLGRGFDNVKVTLPTFFAFFAQFYNNDDKIKQLKLIFKLVDIDNDGVLNILNLLHVYKNIPVRSEFGAEIQKIFEHYTAKNIYFNSISDKVPINYEVY